ncbi:hypothetical protein PG984_000991 [Apiospora sp. TS-2023a]
MLGWEQMGVTAARFWDDLSTDLGEAHDLAASRPEKLRDILHHYETETPDGGVKKRKAEELVNGGPKQ